jgi:hypothetical protein
MIVDPLCGSTLTDHGPVPFRRRISRLLTADGHEQVQLAFCRADLGQVEVDPRAKPEGRIRRVDA